MNLFVRQKWKTNVWTPIMEWGGGMNWETGIHTYTLV